MQFHQANSVEEWLHLASQAKAQADFALATGMYAQAWSRAGFACECVLKASIMAKERLNGFPSRSIRSELYVHDIYKLAGILGMQVDPRDPVAAAWQTVLQWRREHDYHAASLSETVAKDLYDAAFSPLGVIQWLREKYLQNC